jgi:hypothetical protein
MEKITSYIIIFAFGFCVYNIYSYFLFYFFPFGFCVYWLVFLICIVLVFFFSYITIVVNLYGTAHGKNN